MKVSLVGKNEMMFLDYKGDVLATYYIECIELINFSLQYRLHCDICKIRVPLLALAMRFKNLRRCVSGDYWNPLFGTARA